MPKITVLLNLSWEIFMMSYFNVDITMLFLFLYTYTINQIFHGFYYT